MEQLSKLIGATITQPTTLVFEHGYMKLKCESWEFMIKLKYPNHEHEDVHQQVLEMVNCAAIIPTVRDVQISTHLSFRTWFAILEILAGCTQLVRLVVDVCDAWAAMDIVKDASLFALLASVLNSNQSLRELALKLNVVIPARHQCEAFVDAFANHPSLKNIEVRETLLSYETILAILQRNRTIQNYSISLDHVTPGPRPHSWSVSDLNRLESVVSNNWVVLYPCFGTARDKRLTDGCRPRQWREVTRVMQHYFGGLRSLQLSTYVLLWLLDWLPPMSYRYAWKGDPAYDPHHGKKVALIEGLIRSYRRVFEKRQIADELMSPQ